ncbi:hypothetical protein ANCDUO_19070 [Ancylostoma duodenale]|uniref:Uncharacterized protein n=1 Tax=Ancylostoma duodenale TaxID=51022 RepID=A0A0C2FW40_9BILA|nr:hypothetical protein ANCDUO_19070 [Ancylostoma duodenale]
MTDEARQKFLDMHNGYQKLPEDKQRMQFRDMHQSQEDEEDGMIILMS